MASFHDKSGREWELRIDAPQIFKVREIDPKFMLGDTEENNTAKRLGADPALLCHVIYELCAKQRDERSATLEQFYQDVIGNGEAIADAGDALAKAIANFTHPKTREFAERINHKQEEIRELAMEKALAKIDDPQLKEKVLASLETRLDAEIENLLTQLSSATSSPASSASTPPA
jgi:hypothetical protein